MMHMDYDASCKGRGFYLRETFHSSALAVSTFYCPSAFVKGFSSTAITFRGTWKNQ